MESLIALLFFIFGTIIGSFLNVVVLRYECGKSLSGRSACPRCRTRLRWFELVPILSYLVQRGICRTCKNPISIQYPLVEFVSGLHMVGLYYLFGMPNVFFEWLIFGAYVVVGSLLIVILAYDIRHTIIPNPFVYTFNAIAFVLLFVSYSNHSAHIMFPTLTDVAAGPLLFFPFFALWLYSHGRWLGLGDGKLVVGMGWLLGMTGGVSAVLYAFWIGAIVSVVLILIQKMGTTHLAHSSSRFTMKSEIPFAPFIIVGYIIVFFFGIDIVQGLMLW